MDYEQALHRILGSTGHIALASSLENVPNVRIISAYYDRERGVVYIPTFIGSPKTAEFASNAQVAFTTVLEHGSEVVRVSKATVRKSEIPLGELVSGFSQNIPHFEAAFGPAFPMFEVYELHFDEAIVTVTHEQTETVRLAKTGRA